MPDALEGFTLETFAGRVGERFVLEGDGVEHELSLAECNGLGGGAAGRPSFSLIFLGPVDPALSQRTYRLRHEELGSFELFIVPVGRDESGTRYEAVFT